MKNEIVRKGDFFYAEEKNIEIKDSFKYVNGLIRKYKNETTTKISIADIGCAIGTFPDFLRKEYKEDYIIGYEYLDDLITVGREKFPDLKLEKGSILDRISIPKNTYDVITCLGVLSIFDNIEEAISNLCFWIKPSGKLFFHGMFNPSKVDVYIKYKLTSEYDSPNLQSGWNIVSQDTMSRLLKKYGAKKVIYHDFNITIDLPKNKNDPTRSWTFLDSKNKRHIVNGLCIDQPQYVIEVNM
jgi:2-polyprenyl-3-methyl-5-hydroxy-6-metoxy-1,4-benzoquinol methylase